MDEIKDAQFFCKRKLPTQFTTTVPFVISISYLIMFENGRNSRHVRFTETTSNIFQIFTKTMWPI